MTSHPDARRARRQRRRTIRLSIASLTDSLIVEAYAHELLTGIRTPTGIALFGPQYPCVPSHFAYDPQWDVAPASALLPPPLPPQGA